MCGTACKMVLQKTKNVFGFAKIINKFLDYACKKHDFKYGNFKFENRTNAKYYTC